MDGKLSSDTRELLEYLNPLCSSKDINGSVPIGVEWKQNRPANKAATKHIQKMFAEDWQRFIQFVRQLAASGLIGISENKKTSISIWITPIGALALEAETVTSTSGQLASTEPQQPTRGDSMSSPDQTRAEPHWYSQITYFAVAIFCSLISLRLMYEGFRLGNLTPDQRWILRGIFSVTVGFASGAFTGAIKVTSRTRGLLPGAAAFVTGGFAAWLLSHLLWKEPQIPVVEPTKSLSGRLLEQGRTPLSEVTLSTRIDDASSCTTEANGFFRMHFRDPSTKQPGRDVILVHNKDGWVITHPDLKGRIRLPPDGVEVEIWMVKKGDKFEFTHDAMIRIVEDVQAAHVAQPNRIELAPKPDVTRALLEYGRENGFSERQILEQFERWKERAQRSTDLYLTGVLAYCNKDFRAAEVAFLGGAAPYMEGAGDSAYAYRNFKDAAEHYRNALKGIHREHDGAKWQSVQVKRGNALIGFAKSAPPKESLLALDTAVKELREMLRDLTTYSETSRLIWVRAHTCLGDALWSWGERVAWSDGVQILREAEASYRAALQVATPEGMLREWVLLQNNLGATLSAAGEQTGGIDGYNFIEQSCSIHKKIVDKLKNLNDHKDLLAYRLFKSRHLIVVAGRTSDWSLKR